MSTDYSVFRLPGARNIPIDSGYLRLMREISAIDKGASVVVYGQSERCGWADQMAQQLAGRGVRNVLVYEGGVNEWMQRKPGS